MGLDMALLRKHHRQRYRLPRLFFQDNTYRDNSNMRLSHPQDVVAPRLPPQGLFTEDRLPDKNHTSLD